MDDLLVPLQSRPISKSGSGESKTSRSSSKPRDPASSTITSPDDAVRISKSQPSHKQLLELLEYVDGSREAKDGFNILLPSPKPTGLLFALINHVIPAYWDEISTSKSGSDGTIRRLMIRCLRSVPAVGAIISRLRILIDQLKDIRQDQKSSSHQNNKAVPLRQALDLLELVLRKDQCIATLWRQIQYLVSSPTQRSLQWKEFLSLFTSGKILSLSAEANRWINDLSPDIEKPSWLGDGKSYSAWLGRNVRFMLLKFNEDSGEEMAIGAAQVLSKSLAIRSEDRLIEEVFVDALDGREKSLNSHRFLLEKLSSRDQKVVLYALLRALERRLIDSDLDTSSNANQQEFGKLVGAAAGLISALTVDITALQGFLKTWLTNYPTESTNSSSFIPRVVALAISGNQGMVIHAFKKCLETFGDKLFIKHTSIFEQDAQAQIVLLLTGYVHRIANENLISISKSSIYLNAISNRLAAASEKSRFWGMLVGNVVSELVDAKEKRLNFSILDVDEPNFQYYRSLAYVDDKIGSMSDLSSFKLGMKAPGKAIPSDTVSTLNNHKPSQPTKTHQAGAKIISIEEIEDEVSSEDDDLPIYAKADSDASDSEEDPTLVQRKAIAPVYIQDLIKGLRDLENYDRNRLALSKANTLIRQKSNFGTEVTDNARELATILVGLNDKWEMSGFQTYRIPAMVAVLVADPRQMGPWFAETFYNGDYSISQRASILTTLGLGAREVAGMGKKDAEMTGSDESENTFPSKLLPEKLHTLYSSEKPAAIASAAAPLKPLSSNLEKALIEPMAAQAADQISGPNALKVRTFSSRMAVERTKAKPAPNALAKIGADAFLFPLVGRWQIHLRAYGGSSGSTSASATTVTSPFLLSHLLRTFALILDAAGPTLVGLPQVTTELWGLLLSVRNLAIETPVLEGLLVALLTLLEINVGDGGDYGGRRLAEEHARELLETRSWVEDLVERVGRYAGKGEDGKVAVLAATLLHRCQKLVERYQRLLMGDLVGFM